MNLDIDFACGTLGNLDVEETVCDVGLYTIGIDAVTKAEVSVDALLFFVAVVEGSVSLGKLLFFARFNFERVCGGRKLDVFFGKSDCVNLKEVVIATIIDVSASVVLCVVSDTRKK